MKRDMGESSTESFREKFVRTFFPIAKHPPKQADLETKDPLERFEVAITDAAKRRLREREEPGIERQ